MKTKKKKLPLPNAGRIYLEFDQYYWNEYLTKKQALEFFKTFRKVFKI